MGGGGGGWVGGGGGGLCICFVVVVVVVVVAGKATLKMAVIGISCWLNFTDSTMILGHESKQLNRKVSKPLHVNSFSTSTLHNNTN